jgi:hypothetical protein
MTETISTCLVDPHTKQSRNNPIDLYEAWNKPEKDNQRRAELKQIEDFRK